MNNAVLNTFCFSSSSRCRAIETQQSIARLQQGTSAAATTLIKLLVDPATPAAVKARVADSIFNHAAKAMEIKDIELRVATLEASAGADAAK